MNLNSKIFFAVISALLGIFLALVWFPVPASALQLPTQLVPECGPVGDVQSVCSICHIFQLVDNILNFIFAMAAVGAVVMLLWGGFLLILPWPDPNRYTRGRKVLLNAFIGVLIIFFAWLAVDTIIKILAKQTVSPGGISGYGPWNQIPCDVFTVGAGSGTPPLPIIPPPIVGPDPIAIVAQQLKSGDFGTASCKDIFGSPVGAKTTIDELADSKPVTVCSSGCTGQSVCQQNPSVKVSAPMLGALSSTRVEGKQFIISSITTGSHSSLSCHYSGNCVDVVPKSGSIAEWENIRSSLASKVSGAIVKCEQGGSFVDCGAINPSNPTAHIHASCP